MIDEKTDQRYQNKILIISENTELKQDFLETLRNQDYQVIFSMTGRAGLRKIEECIPDLIFLDLVLPDINSSEVIKEIKKIDQDAIVIIITSEEIIQPAKEVANIGAYDYIPKTLPKKRLKTIVEKAIHAHNLSKEVVALKYGGILLEKIIGHSLKMQKIFKLIRTAAHFDINVIITGETGTGKELVARAIHGLSKRKNKPFIPVDCASLSETLFESELFGHDKGSYTGAGELVKGRFELANQGTLFLDEIGNLDRKTQAKLLRALQERKIMRVGGQKLIDVDIRIISATNIDLREAIKNNSFRIDLFHRINVFEINLPSLRERGNDIMLLSYYFLNKFNRELDLQVKRLSEEVKKIFNRYYWPGNIRELENVIKSAMIFANSDTLLPEHLPPNIKHAKDKIYLFDHFDLEELLGINVNPEQGTLPLKEIKKHFYENIERGIIKKALDKTHWNKKKTAEFLDIDSKSLFNKIENYHLRNINS
jgi:two-component system, NtrC family, response regulator AtoC